MAEREPVVILTGASAGIGAELARVFARDGHRLVLIARSGEKLAALAREIVAAGGAEPLVLALDLQQPGMADKVDAEFFPDGQWKSNFLCILGKGVPSSLPPRNPRFSFEEVCKVL